LVYLRPFPRLFHKDCIQQIFDSRGEKYPFDKCQRANIKDAWELAWPDVDELQATIAMHDEGFKSETKQTKQEEGGEH